MSSEEQAKIDAMLLAGKTSTLRQLPPNTPISFTAFNQSLVDELEEEVMDDEPGDPAGFCGWGPEFR